MDFDRFPLDMDLYAGLLIPEQQPEGQFAADVVPVFDPAVIIILHDPQIGREKVIPQKGMFGVFRHTYGVPEHLLSIENQYNCDKEKIQSNGGKDEKRKFHIDRIAGRDCHHRHSCLHAAPRAECRAGKSKSGSLS
ncbi:hypothetical protein SDC9_200781 [bioreactor metagenome]|uniref:Uncharacterized protein n=1 Tax=bioreactor metagenome TaxID=1076179 RepID=A0A645IPF3_9ZZZZ